MIWLDSYLSRWKKTLVVVSHDQDFLSNVCDQIVHLENHQLFYYKGTFDDFKKMHAQKMDKDVKDYEQQQKRLKELKVSRARHHAPPRPSRP